MKLAIAACAAAVWCWTAGAREPDGTLGAIRIPNEGRPAFVQAGGAFDVLVSERAVLTLEQEGVTIPLEVAWTATSARGVQGQCSVPAGVTAGAYALHAEIGGRTDDIARAVRVYDSFPDTYNVAHLAAPELDGSDERYANVFAALRAIETAGADFVLITGSLTLKAQEYSNVLRLLQEFAMPVVVSPGETDNLAGFAAFFGPATGAFWFGEDAFLALDTSEFRPLDDSNETMSQLYRLRRKMKRARWSVGFGSRYSPRMSLRAQLTLFVDDPLDFVLMSEAHVPEDTGVLPWGHTAFLTTPPASAGAYRLIEVTLARPVPHPAQVVAPDQPVSSLP